MSLLLPDSGLLFWMFVAFGIVLVILAKYGFPIIIRMVEDRKVYIDQSLEVARKQADIAAQKELDAVRQQIQVEKDEAIRDIRRQVAVLSVDIAEKVLRKSLQDKEAQMGMIDRMLDEVLTPNKN